MATLFLPPGRTTDAPAPARVGTATLVFVLSPIRSPDGKLHVQREPVAAGQSVAAALPARGRYGHVIWNGAPLTPAQQTKVLLNPGDEVTVFPAWGTGIEEALLVSFVVGLAVSIATTALTYVLFPPSKPHVDAPDPHTNSWEGIRTAIGPGNIKPVLYGVHRMGGQLLSAAVTQALTILDTGATVTHLTAIDTPPTLDLLLAFGEGPISGFLLETCELNGQPLANFPGVQVFTRLGTPDQPPIAEFNETRNTFADGRALPDNSANTGQEILYTTTEPVTAFVLNVVFNQGLFNMNGQGEKEENMVNVAYRFKPVGTGAWQGYFVFQVSAQRTAPVRFAIRRENLPLGAYDIAINYGGIRHTDELKSKSQPTLESVTEIQAGAHAYPSTALLGIRAVATDQLQGAIPNITIVCHGRKVRVSTFNTGGELHTDNPAWCVMDLMTNSRYGMGILDSEIDLGAFQVWANYCDEIVGGERRHVLNYVLEREGRSQATLMEIMGGSRTLMLKSEGFWTPRPTRNDPPGPLLSWATCSNLKVTYTRDPDRVNVMEARFANEEDGFEQDVLAWPTVEHWPIEVRKASLEIRGVTKPSRIMRALQFELNRRKFENVTIEFDNAIDGVTMQVHDLFRFSHPMPGWGTSGRLLEGSTQTRLFLDEYVRLQAGVTYQVYLKYITDFTEARVVYNPGDTTTNVLDFGVPFSFTPTPRDTLWAFGTAGPEGAVRVFRAVRVERKSDTTVHIQGIIHNPTIYDEATATPLPGGSDLPNPLGAPPPLTALVATEVTRIQPSGASLRVVNLAWSVAPLGGGMAPYGGAKVYRRSVNINSTVGNIIAGGVDLGAIQDPNDPNYNYIFLVQVSGHVLETDDFTVVTGSSYVYRVVPISGRSVPNEAGALTALIHVGGPTTPDFFPGTPRNLRLQGKAVGVTTWEGRDVHLVWDTVADSPLFSQTFYVNDYLVQVWAPDQSSLLRSTNTGGVLAFNYTFAMNQEDHLRNGIAGAQRDLLFLVYAHTNTDRISLDPATLTVHNPPPDMSHILPDAASFAMIGIISWDQYVEDIDLDHYEVHLDIVNPPIQIYQDLEVNFHGVGNSFRKVFPAGLSNGYTYYTFIIPYDTFGPGLPSQTASFVAGGITIDDIDSTPPATPTNLHLTTGTDVSPDGTIIPWVEASWDRAPESDVSGYEVHVFLGEGTVVPTVWNPTVAQHSIHFEVPGHTLVRVKLLAFDHFHNISPFSAEASITSAGDTNPPGSPANLTAIGSIKAVALLWTPPADADYDHCEVWSATTNNRGATGTTPVGTGRTGFVHEGLGANDTRYYWIRAVDTSGNVSAFHPVSATGGVSGKAGQLDTTYIENIAANKILAGTIQALVSVGVANRILLDGPNQQIAILDNATGNYRVILGKLSALTEQWGLQLFNPDGALMWNFVTGATTQGISDASITAQKIQAAQIQSQHLITNTAVITFAAQIATAIINDAHITNLAAHKILSDNILAQFLIGVGSNIMIDGANSQIRILDASSATRVVLGHVPAFAPDGDWSMQIYTPGGALMWDALLGALNDGIGPAAVTTEKIYANAVTAAIVASNFANQPLPTFPEETVVGDVFFPSLNVGDQVWMVGKFVAVLGNLGADGTNVYLTLRADSVTGGVFDQSRTLLYAHTGGDTGCLVAQYLWNITTPMTNKHLVMTAYAAAATNVSIDTSALVAIRTRR